MQKKIKDLEKRVSSLEKKINLNQKLKPSMKTSEKEFVSDLDKLMTKHGNLFEQGIIFSGLAMPSNNPNRLVRWSGCGGFKNENEVNDFIENAKSDDIAKFCSNFSSPEKLLIVKSLMKYGPMGQKEILELTRITQGQFYHHLKDMLSSKMVEKHKKDKYDLSPVGHVLSMSFIGIINAFVK